MYTSNADEYATYSKKLQQTFIGRRLEKEEVNESLYEQAAVAGDVCRTEFFVPERIERLVHSIVCNLLSLTAGELQEWVESPEEFQSRYEAATMRDELRCSAELLFLALMGRYPDQVTSILVGFLQQPGLTEVSVNTSLPKAI